MLKLTVRSQSQAYSNANNNETNMILNTYSTSRKRINSFFTKKKLNNIFSRIHGSNVKNIVVILEREFKNRI